MILQDIIDFVEGQKGLGYSPADEVIIVRTGRDEDGELTIRESTPVDIRCKKDNRAMKTIRISV